MYYTESNRKEFKFLYSSRYHVMYFILIPGINYYIDSLYQKNNPSVHNLRSKGLKFRQN